MTILASPLCCYALSSAEGPRRRDQGTGNLWCRARPKPNRRRALAPEDLPHLVSLDGVEISWARRRKEVLAHRPTDFICALVERLGVRQNTNSLFRSLDLCGSTPISTFGSITRVNTTGSTAVWAPSAAISCPPT